MDTSSYLARLESLLSGIPAAERQYAVAYYTEYLMDAGPDGAEAAMASLGTPESLAAQIKADVAMRGLANNGSSGRSSSSTQAFDSRQQAQSGFDSRSVEEPWVSGQENNQNQGAQGQWNQAGPAQTFYTQTEPAKKQSPLSTIVIVLLAIFALPIGLPIAAVLFALVIALVATVGSLFIGAVATGVSLLLASIAIIAAGIVLLFSQWAVGLFYLGCGLMLFSLSLLFNLGMYHLLRLIFKGIAYMFDSIRRALTRRHAVV